MRTLILLSSPFFPTIMLLAPKLRKQVCRKALCSFHSAPSELTMPVTRVRRGSGRGSITIALQEAGEFGVGSAGEDGLAEGLSHEGGVGEDDDALAAQEDLVHGAEAAGQLRQGDVEVLVQEGQEAQQRHAARTGGQVAAAGAQQQPHDEEDDEEEQAETDEQFGGGCHSDG